MSRLIPPNTGMDAVRQICRSNPLFHGISLGIKSQSKASIIEEMNERIINQWALVGSVHAVKPLDSKQNSGKFCLFALVITLIAIMSLYIACNQNEKMSVQQSMLLDRQRSTIVDLEAQIAALHATQKEMVNQFQNAVAEFQNLQRTLNQTGQTLAETCNELKTCKAKEVRAANQSQDIQVEEEIVEPLKQTVESLSDDLEENDKSIHLILISWFTIIGIVAILYWLCADKYRPKNDGTDDGQNPVAGHDGVRRKLHKIQNMLDQEDELLSMLKDKGVKRELGKMDLQKLHELETHYGRMIAAFQNVREVINHKKEQTNECRICRDQDKDTALIPCGHQFCSKCVLRFHECPLCRMWIDDTLKLCE